MFSYTHIRFLLLPNLDFSYSGSPITTMSRVKCCLLHQYWFRGRIVDEEDDKFILDKCSNIFISKICSDIASKPSFAQEWVIHHLILTPRSSLFKP